MHLLIVYAHPRTSCYTHAVAQSLARGVAERGHTSELADLYREGFQPCLAEPDYAQFSGVDMPQDVAREQARVERADGLAFVFPVWWWSFPAGALRASLDGCLAIAVQTVERGDESVRGIFVVVP